MVEEGGAIASKALIAESVKIIVSLEVYQTNRGETKRRISQLIELQGFDEHKGFLFKEIH